MKSVDYQIDVPDELYRVICQRAADEGKTTNLVMLESLARALGLNPDIVTPNLPKPPISGSVSS